MLNPNKLGLDYSKPKKHRDAKIIYIFCEGDVREFDYFNFFADKSSRLKINVYPPFEGQSAPDKLLENADLILKQDINSKTDEIWFVIDTDRWEIRDFIKKCKQKKHEVVVSNPSFEVWLYFHVDDKLPKKRNFNLKEYLNKRIKGGFDSNIHPLLIETAIDNPRRNFKGNQQFPEINSTSVFYLGEKIFALTKKEISYYLEKYKTNPKLVF